MIKNLFEQTDEQQKLSLIKRAEEILNEQKTWDDSQQMFCKRFNKRYSQWYPDMVIPLISAAAQVNTLCYHKE